MEWFVIIYGALGFVWVVYLLALMISVQIEEMREPKWYMDADHPPNKIKCKR